MNELTIAEIQALNEALDDEYRAIATYEQVLADFGEVPPFSHICESKKRHIEALCRLLKRYGQPVPENPWPGKVGRFASLQGVCETAVAAEIANAEIYDRLLKSTDRPDILKVFLNLRKASQQNHLPSFRRGAKEFPSCGHEGDGDHR